MERNQSLEINPNSARGAGANLQNSQSKTSFYSDMDNNSKLSHERISAIQESFFELAIQDPVLNNNLENPQELSNQLANSSLLTDRQKSRLSMLLFDCRESKSLVFWKIFCFWILIPFFIIYLLIVYAYNLISFGCSCFANSKIGRSTVNCLRPFVNCSKICLWIILGWIHSILLRLARGLRLCLELFLLPIKGCCQQVLNSCYKVCCI